jgi:hypothetical protein
MKVINLPIERLKREQRKIKNITSMTFSDYIDYLLEQKANGGIHDKARA